MKAIPDDLAAKLDDVGDQFLARGSAGRLDELATEIGVPRATLYYYFSGKDDLVTYFMRDKMKRVAHRIQQAKATDAPAIDRFAAALRGTAHELAGKPALCMNLMVAMGRMDAMAELMTASDHTIMSPLRELLIEARAQNDLDIPDIDLTIAAIMGGIYMAVLQRYAQASHVDPDEIADTIVAQAIHGLHRRPRATPTPPTD